MHGTLSDDDLQRLYAWVDEISLSRPKRNIARDFSDGVLVAEVVAHYFPKLVDLHNYAAANAVDQKTYNWDTLNEKVFKKMQCHIPKVDVEAVVQCKPGAIEKVLYTLQLKMARYRARAKASSGASAASSTMAEEHRREHAGGGGDASSTSPPDSKQALAEKEEENKHQQQRTPLRPSPDRLTLKELRETNDLLRLKIAKLEQLVNLKDAKMQRLAQELESLRYDRGEDSSGRSCPMPRTPLPMG